MAESEGPRPEETAFAERLAGSGDGLLATKLDVPRVRSDYLRRSRLVSRLDSGNPEGVVLVCTPAGFGKSSLLADWATDTSTPVAWVSLGPEDNDPVRFWRYVAAALGRTVAGITEHLLPLLRPPSTGSGEGIVTALVNELRDTPGDLTLVLDDYHVIESSAVHEAVALLLARAPARLQVVVSSRADPPLPLPQLRAQGRLRELRAADLRLTAEESASLLRDSWGLGLTAENVATLHAKTEGWAVGLQLAALALRDQANVDAAVRAFAGTHRFVLDYLSDEVLDRQSDHVRTFLMQCSVLRRLNGRLCDALTGRSDGQQMLEDLERANLFLIPMDEERRWYRFHHLFGNLLRDRLGRAHPDWPADLHRAAGEWFEKHGLPDDTIHHALEADDPTWAARLIERHVDELLLRSEGVTLQRWIAALPTALVESRPRLLLSRVRFNLYRSRLDEIEPQLDAAERALGTDDAEPFEPSAGRSASPLANVGATLALLRAFVTHLRGDAEGTVRYASEALSQIEVGEWALNGIAQSNLATAHWLRGRLAEAERAMAANLAAWRSADDPGRVAWSCHYLGQIQRSKGRLAAADGMYRRVLDGEGAADRAPQAVVGVARVGMAAVAYQRGELEVARRHVTDGIAACHQFVHTLPLAAGLATLAWIRQAEGDAASAREAMNEAGRVADPAVVDLLNPVPALRAQLLLAQGGTLPTAADWAAERDLDPDADLSYPREPAYLLLARLLLAEQQPDLALRLLDRLHSAAADQHRTGSIIEIDALRALARHATGDQPSAHGALDNALVLAQPEDYIRVFVDEGAPMAGLLKSLVRWRQRNEPGSPSPAGRAHANRVLRAFRPPPRDAGSVTAAALPSPLTRRELEVLRLVAEGRRNQQIANELVVTLDTVKKHVSHIYTKLGAANRTEALARARDLDLISLRAVPLRLTARCGSRVQAALAVNRASPREVRW